MNFTCSFLFPPLSRFSAFFRPKKVQTSYTVQKALLCRGMREVADQFKAPTLSLGMPQVHESLALRGNGSSFCFTLALLL
eukprot:m.29801 g.29801  ORF g.29801 m.29801 type:complete len:80 (-) comp14410_c0_seq1:404-643(-)